DNQGPQPGFVNLLRQRNFDRVYVLYANHPGYWKLKLLPFALGAGAIFAINENLDWFPVDLRHTQALAAHLRWRMESSVTLSGQVQLSGLWSAVKAVAYPAVLAYRAGYEQFKSRRSAS